MHEADPARAESIIDRGWRSLERVLAALSCLALFALVALPFVQVVLRDLFTSPIVGLEEGTRWGLITLVFLALPLLVSTNGQIRFAELIDQLPRAMRRMIERVTMLLSGCALAVVVWAGIGSILMNKGTRTPTLDIPFWLFASPFLVGATLAAIGYLWFAVRPAPPPIDIPPPIL